ncbi:MAG TPA: hypothetical protein PK675_04075 [Clostridia bacterium]|nr:hypothetical protein [Clostridia bacterium]
MAAPIVRGGILKAIITTVVVLAVIVGVVALVANITPNQVGLGNININGQTLNDLGLADYKVKDIFTAIKSLSEDATAFIDNPIDAEAEASAEALLGGSSIVDGTGQVDYTAIYTDKVVYDEVAEIEYQDVELGALANNCLQQLIATNALNGQAVLVYNGNQIPSNVLREGTQYTINDFEIKIEALTITVAETTHVNIVVSFDLSALTQDPQVQPILDAIENTGFIKIPDPLKVIVAANIEVIYDATTETISFGTDSTILLQNNQLLTDSLFALLNEQAESIKSMAINQVGEVFCRIVNNLGKVKSIENGKIVFETFTLSDIG